MYNKYIRTITVTVDAVVWTSTKTETNRDKGQTVRKKETDYIVTIDCFVVFTFL